MVYYESNGSNTINRIRKGSWSLIKIAFHGRYYIYAMCISISLRNNYHPWWLVAGSIPVMVSYGHGFGDPTIVCLNILCLGYI